MYDILWEEEYDNVIVCLKRKYKNKREIGKLEESIKKYVDKTIALLELYPNDEIQEENGLSDWADIQFAKGQIYRDVCMFLITNLCEEYIFWKKIIVKL